MDEVFRKFHNRRILARGAKVMVMARPSRCMLFEVPAKRDTAPKKKTSFSSFMVLLSRLVKTNL